MNHSHKWAHRRIDTAKSDSVPTEPHYVVLVFRTETYITATETKDVLVTDYYAFSPTIFGGGEWNNMRDELHVETDPQTSSHARIPNFVAFFSDGARTNVVSNIDPYTGLKRGT